ncbi:phage tail assembly chaperone [Pseudomonas sp. Choline-02u-1]|jgi:hypothetical protein|uniref:phage tail assembly chaperone n=1 Tax=Pseudomonas sp. Choline-02u-1 TaxID=2058307 RepID=UPI002114D03B|nr:phage tail assembly chaperone [Pseudomonas sp. Choline-02u-1]
MASAKMYYSKSTGCTYLEGMHDGQMPEDALPISKERYQAVIADPEPGMVRSHDAEGLPILVVPEVTPDELVRDERAWRDAEIIRITWLRDRHRDEIEIGSDTTQTAEQYAELLAYIKALRDWPAQIEFPAEEFRPVVPEWVASQTP